MLASVISRKLCGNMCMPVEENSSAKSFHRKNLCCPNLECGSENDDREIAYVFLGRVAQNREGCRTLRFQRAGLFSSAPRFREIPHKSQIFLSGDFYVCKSLTGPRVLVFFHVCRWTPLPHSTPPRPSFLHFPSSQGSAGEKVGEEIARYFSGEQSLVEALPVAQDECAIASGAASGEGVRDTAQPTLINPRQASPNPRHRHQPPKHRVPLSSQTSPKIPSSPNRSESTIAKVQQNNGF